jgi:signal recognition particle receptor subunit beta
VKKKCRFIFAKVICRGAQVVRVLILLLDGNQRQSQAAKVREVLFLEKRKESLHKIMKQDLETSGPLSQVGNLLF